MLAADDGTNSDYSIMRGLRIPVLHAAPPDQDGRQIGGPDSEGVRLPEPGEGWCGWVTVRDAGDGVRVEFIRRDEFDAEKMRLSFAV